MIRTGIRNGRALLALLDSEIGAKLLAYIAGLFFGIIFMLILLFSATPHADASSPRIKDIVTFEGIRENVLVGYGLVVGLNGTGDKLNNSAFTEKSLRSFLGRLGVSTANENLKVKNVAAVTITATLPAFARTGSKIDITISTLGDAKSLEGGNLVATPLMGADGEMYAVAQGAVSIGGFTAEGNTNSVTKGVPTTGFISNGAIVEREIAFELDELSQINISLNSPDLTTAKAIETTINNKLGDIYARATDPGTVSLSIPLEYSRSVATLLANIELLNVATDQIARVVIDEGSGTVVMNSEVTIDSVAVAQGNLIVTIAKTPEVIQPGAFAPDSAETALIQQEAINVTEEKGNIAVIGNNANLQDLVNGLNSLGVSTRDLITILQTIKHAGALHADIVTR